ncbi:hypothetical protein [Clostridium thermobutyricum]|nr:hypothetical protein [Clostridium thermobutyricum]
MKTLIYIIEDINIYYISSIQMNKEDITEELIKIMLIGNCDI